MKARIENAPPRMLKFQVIFLLATALWLASLGVHALETGVCEIEILIDGRPLTELAARGTTYVEAVRGREYAIRLHNRSDRRIAVALAVDGLNSIDAKRSDEKSASKWVLGPHQTTTIEGWQTSSESARRFIFTSEDRSYGSWLGTTDNLGVIEAVVFRERRTRNDISDSRRFKSAAPEAGRRPRTSAVAAPPADADDLAATGIGRRVEHRGRRVRLDLEDHPSSRLRIRYEYRPQLVHLGILPSTEESAALARRERARGFEGFEFAPDPFAPMR